MARPQRGCMAVAASILRLEGRRPMPMLLLPALAAAVVLPFAAASPFDPHPLPPKGPYFEGWFTRVVDPVAGSSFAIIVGSYEARESKGELSQSWVAAVVAHADGSVYTEQVFPDPASVSITVRGQPVERQHSNGPAQFEWSSEVGRLNVSSGFSNLEFHMPSGLSISASLVGRVPWDTDCPDTCGPEGWIRHAPGRLLPTHYFVENLAALAHYRIGSDAGSGIAHMEANYGSRFPAAWLWVQAVASDGETQLLATQGKFSIAGVTLPQFVIGYRSRKYRWDFRSIDLDRIRLAPDACSCILGFAASSFSGHRRLELDIAAPCSSFSEPLYVPTVEGFSKKPGSVESYNATAHVRLFDGAGALLEAAVLQQAALEFGGEYRCAADVAAEQALQQEAQQQATIVYA